MTRIMPAPPDFMVKIRLDGPFDKDIPAESVKQLKGASVGADWGIPYIFMSVGMHFESLGDETRTLHFYDRALSEFRKRGNAGGEGSALNRKVFALYEFGRVREAFDLIRQKEKDWPSAPMDAFVAHNYGHYHLMNGDYAQALSDFQRSCAANEGYGKDFDFMMLRRDSELESGIAAILADYVPRMTKKYSLLDFDPAMLAAIRARQDEGIAHLRRVLDLNSAIRKTKPGSFTPPDVFRIMETNVNNFLGLAAGIKGDWDTAFNHLDRASRLAREEGYRVGEVDSLFFREQVFLLKQDITAGLKAARELNELADRYRFPFYQIWAKFILSRYETGFGNAPGAIAALKEAAAIIEAQRSALVIDQLKESYLFNRQVVYEALVEVLAREGDSAGALDYAEHSKARLLVDLLAGQDLGRSPAERSLLRQEQAADQEVAGLGKRLAAARSDPAAQELLAGLAKAEGAYRDIVVKVKRENTELASLVSVQSPAPSVIQARLPADTALLDYFVTDQTLYVWAVDRDKVHLERVKLGREDLRALVASFLKAIQAKDQAATKALSQKLYDILLKPILPFVTAPNIGLAPHDALYYLPFSALSDQGKYLIESRALFSLPNAGVLEYLAERKPQASLRVLAFGNPDLGRREFDLPSAEAEVAAIKGRFPSAVVFTGKAATGEKAKELLGGDFDVAHFAAHGNYSEETPLESGLLLAPTAADAGRLSALDIFKLRFKGSAVVLSACKTALGRSATGSEIVGLNRSFLYAGAPSVLATLWSIDDKATAELMGSLYAGLEKKEGLAESLRLAQLEMVRKGLAPYFWAAFLVTGRG
ncbi:MAG: CHAT domain-containing protein [Elusimicrobia bacterium]|nr:CHAT domain-containing protein [Elusimicrobiota bacterium]